MGINKDTLIMELQSAITGFVIDPEWIPDNLGYLIINDLARYMCDQAFLSDWEELKKGMDFLERSLEGGDSYMRDLVHECLETFLSCDHVGEIKKYFGPQTLELWNQFMDETYQRRVRDRNLH
ncbi:MAG TPA: hypothetical protein VK738_10710 [Terriglobales bacterium]|nr:hypothetical protein [Terriglobales bacterium]